MRRGPPPIPTAILAARGSWRAKTRTNEPSAPGGPLKAPAGLSPEQRIIWRALVKDLAALGVAATVDARAVERYVVLFSQWRKCREFVTKNGEFRQVRNADGIPIGLAVWPQAERLLQHSAVLLRLEQEFGLTPAARARLGSQVTIKREPDDTDEFCNPN